MATESTPEISLTTARGIAALHTGTPERDLKPCGSQGVRTHVGAHLDSAWWFTAPWNDGYDGYILRSSRLLGVAKADGVVIFDGSANDEG